MGVELNITENNVNQYKNIHLNPICCHPPVSYQVIMLTILLFRNFVISKQIYSTCNSTHWLVDGCVPINKRQRDPKGQSRMDNPEKLVTLSTKTQDEEQNKMRKKHNRICVGHYYTTTKINNVNKIKELRTTF